MAPAVNPTPSSPNPFSPRSPVSPGPPDTPLGEAESRLLELAYCLLQLGASALDTQAGPKDKDKPGLLGEEKGTSMVGTKVNETIQHLAALDDLGQLITTYVPFQALDDIDNSRNPNHLTRERVERAATENQFMNGKIAAIESYRELLGEALAEHFPELAPELGKASMTAMNGHR